MVSLTINIKLYLFHDDVNILIYNNGNKKLKIEEKKIYMNRRWKE